MREYYRWNNGLRFDAALDPKSLGRWLQAQETHWAAIEDQAYERLRIGGYSFDPFDTCAINEALREDGLVYSAGIGNRGAAHFFLARLEAVREHAGCRILIAGIEHARDASALPAMSLGSTVFIRRDAIARMLWEKAQEADWHQGDTPMRRALRAYGYEDDAHAAIARMSDDQLETFVQHELGEVQANALLGEPWQALLADALGGGGEMLIRAVRDNLADALNTLPHLLGQRHPAPLHFYMSTLGPLRKSLQPGLLDAYETWRSTQQLAPLQALAARSREHWLSVARQMISQGLPRDSDEFVTAHCL